MGLLDWIVLPLLIFTHDDEFDYVVIPEVQGEASSDSGPQFFSFSFCHLSRFTAVSSPPFLVGSVNKYSKKSDAAVGFNRQTHKDMLTNRQTHKDMLTINYANSNKT